MISINKVENIEDIKVISAIGEKIWREYYTPIIGIEQVEYMLDKFQSVNAITNQINNEGYEYYLLSYEEHNAGYIGIKVNDVDLFLSKLYVDKEYRKKGIANDTIEFLSAICKEKGLNRIWLTVNKYNESSIAAYKKLGFEKVDEQVADIGSGYVMDDFIMEKNNF